MSQNDYRTRLLGDPWSPNPQVALAQHNAVYIRFLRLQSVTLRFIQRLNSPVVVGR